MAKKVLFVAISLLVIMSMLAACAPKAVETPEVETVTETEAGKLKVFGAFATPIEEPWDGAVHGALLKAQENGLIDYTFTENIGYAGDMERVLREAAENEKPDIIVMDSYGNEEAARRVAAEYPEIAFVAGSGGGPVDPNFSLSRSTWSNSSAEATWHGFTKTLDSSLKMDRLSVPCKSGMTHSSFK